MKKSDLSAAVGYRDMLLTLLLLRVQYFSNPDAHSTVPFFPQQIEQEIDFEGNQHFQVSSPGEHSGWSSAYL